MLKRAARLLNALLRVFGLNIARIVPPQPLPVAEDIDPRIQDIIDSVRPFTMTSPERINAMCEAIHYIERRRIPGTIVECGVWRGGSMLAAAKMLKTLNSESRDLYLFDTFSGMSAPTEFDVARDGSTAQTLLEAESRVEGDSVWAWASLEDVKKNIATSGYAPERIHFVEGMVEQTVPSRAPEQIALLRLDTDWYESTAHELRHLVPRMPHGAVIIIDDYGHWQGARRAVDEFFSTFDPPIMLHRVDYTGRAAIVDRS